MRDRLDPEARALWARVAASVRPLTGRIGAGAGKAAADVPPPAAGTVAVAQRLSPSPRAPHPAQTPVRPGETLDGGWDRRLARGVVAPDRTIDLHGHTLASAHAALDHALARAIADDARLLLIVTGRPPRRGDVEPRRGLIRANIGDWLALSSYTARIAAVRGAHPRHGGAGALYVVLRRRRQA